MRICRTNFCTAVAQGITAQARIFGGSIGIAASTCILGVVERRELKGIPNSVLSALQASAHSLTAEQYMMIQQAYADAFSESMRTNAIVACAGFLLALGMYQRHPMTMEEKRQEAAEPGQ